MRRDQLVVQWSAPCCAERTGRIQHPGDRIPGGTTPASLLLKWPVQVMPCSFFAKVVCFGRLFERGADHDTRKLSRVLSRPQFR